MTDTERLVIGIDSSTQSVKAIAWSRDGTPMAEGRATHDIHVPSPLIAEQDARQWWSAAQEALRQLTAQIDMARVDAMAISNQRETMVLTDAGGDPIAPATVWLDRRSRDAVDMLAAEVGRDRLHQITGKPVDTIPCVYRLRHFRAHTPELLDRAAHVYSVHDFLTRKLTGTASASWTSADPFGLFDIAAKQWSPEILAALGVPVTKLPPAHRPGSRIGSVTAGAAAATGLPQGLAVFAAGGDGHCAGLGSGVIAPGTMYLNLGTALVAGAWSPNPELSSYWRTLTSPTGEGYILETAQRGGAYFVNWLVDTFAGGRSDPAVFARLTEAAANLPVGSEGVLVCSYLLGCMDPHWDGDARATFTGMGPDTGMGHLYRASLEAITLEYARALAQMRAAGVRIDRITTIGGGAQSKLWLRMIADATGTPVQCGLSNEASALGAGMTAAVGAGWYAGFAEAVAAMSRVADTTMPDPGAGGAWADLSRRQAQVYQANRGLY
ncbi:MAG: FGGY-family carbohydrate kinase [Paracoccus sp. (in: a-proteobacteria)]|jgi:xylulokinase